MTDQSTSGRYRWMMLQRLWDDVLESDTTLSCRSGGWKVKLEYSGEGLAPIAGEPDEIVVYRKYREVGRWTLREIDAGTDRSGGER